MIVLSKMVNGMHVFIGLTDARVALSVAYKHPLCEVKTSTSLILSALSLTSINFSTSKPIPTSTMALFYYPHQHVTHPTRHAHRCRRQYPDFETVLYLTPSNDESEAPETATPTCPRFELDADGTFKAAVSTLEYEPSDLKVEVDGRDLVVSGEHSSSDEHGNSHQRSFVSRLRLPEELDLESVKCDYDEDAHALRFIGHAVEINPHLTSIPITFKEQTETTQVSEAESSSTEKEPLESNGDAWVEV
uniref:SHSP domain-containing protein n=1 Tax=Panagrellus redivivus TaxID=6233 RepID=A0A7E4VX33_PANRE